MLTVGYGPTTRECAFRPRLPRISGRCLRSTERAVSWSVGNTRRLSVNARGRASTQQIRRRTGGWGTPSLRQGALSMQQLTGGEQPGAGLGLLVANLRGYPCSMAERLLLDAVPSVCVNTLRAGTSHSGQRGGGLYFTATVLCARGAGSRVAFGKIRGRGKSGRHILEAESRRVDWRVECLGSSLSQRPVGRLLAVLVVREPARMRAGVAAMYYVPLCMRWRLPSCVSYRRSATSVEARQTRMRTPQLRPVTEWLRHRTFRSRPRARTARECGQHLRSPRRGLCSFHPGQRRFVDTR